MNKLEFEKLTRMGSSLDNEINSKTELRGNQNEKWGSKQLVSPGYRIYPMVDSIPYRFVII